ncbi:MAG: peptidoglycan-binding protein, partial [Actinobacteria bacterium]|nr:peptidoglycan-binding protein [Actinomycetota bacterium]
MLRKNRVLAVGLAAVILSSLVSWGAASRIRSPAEVAARTAPPKPSAITVPVEKKVLSSDVVARGTVRYGAPQSVLLPGSSIRKGSAILTSAPEKGKDLTEGSVAFTISGRPALVLQGAVPAYRDITPGAVGDDVRQLQEALGRLGFHPGRTDGVYDDRTGLAVAAWYLKAGWSPSGPSDEQLQALRSAQADWFSAESDLIGAQADLTAARNDYDIAKQRAAAAARAAGPTPHTTAAPARPPTTDDQAASRAEQERVNANLRVKKARRDLQKAEEEEKAAQARLDEARTRKPPPSNQEYAALSKRSQDASAKVAAAREELTAAEDAASSASDRGGTSAGPEASSPAPPDQTAQLDAATAQAEARKAADAVSFAQKKVGLAAKRTNSGPTGTKLGIQIPAGEILFFPRLPVRVDEAKIHVGEEATGAVMTVT